MGCIVQSEGSDIHTQSSDSETRVMARDAYNYWLKQQIAYPPLAQHALQKVATGITNARVEGVFSML